MSNLDSLWDFSDPSASETRFLAALIDGEHERAEVLTQIARAQGLQKQFTRARETLEQARCQDPSPRVRIRIFLEEGRLLNSSGNPSLARPLFEQAWEMALKENEDALAADAAHMVAITCEGNEAIAWNQKGLDLAESSADIAARSWRGSILNNLGWSYHDLCQFDQALVCFTKAVEAREEQGKPVPVRIARWCVGRCLRSLERFDEALAIQLELLEDGDGDGFGYEEVGECLNALGRSLEAQPYFARAYELLSNDPYLAEYEPKRLRRLQKLAMG